MWVKNSRKVILLTCTLLTVFLIYSFSLNRDWIYFDEKVMYFEEGLFPLPANLNEMFEIISTFAFSHNFDSQNPMVSNIVNIRSTPFGAILNIVVYFIFQKNAFLYHFLGVFLHLLSTALVFFIFYRLLAFQNLTTNEASSFSAIFALIWALHPVNIEGVELATNWPGLLTYVFCFGFFLYNLRKLTSLNYTSTIPELILIPFLSLLLLLTCEYFYTFSFIIFFTSFAFSYKRFNSIYKSLTNSLQVTLPYFIGILLYLVYSIIRFYPGKENIATHYQAAGFSFEGLFWLAPQIFVHFFKLFFFPKVLSLYQANLIKLEYSYFSPIVILSLLMFVLFLLTPYFVIVKIKLKNEKSFVFFLFYALLFSLFPFLHVVSPTYCLIAERYCYFPLFITVFIILIYLSKEILLKHKKATYLTLSILLLILSARTMVRLNEWKDSLSLYNSALKSTNNSFCKGIYYSIIGNYFGSENKPQEMNKYFSLSAKEFNSVLDKLKEESIKYTNQPKILKVYGLDPVSLRITAAFKISSMRLFYVKEDPYEILRFYEPFLVGNLDFAGNQQINLYAKLLLKTKRIEEAIRVLEFGKLKYPYSLAIISTLSNIYLKLKDITNAKRILREGFYYYPNYKLLYPRLIELCQLKNDFLLQAKYEYLIGLLTHSLDWYQNSAKIYLSLNKLSEAKKILDKLVYLDRNNPITTSLFNNYYLLKEQR